MMNTDSQADLIRGRRLASVALLILLGAGAFPAAQIRSEEKLAFDVISIKRNHSMRSATRNRTIGGRLTIENMTVRQVVLEYYRVKDYQIAGAIPSWVDSERYDILATTDPGAKWSTMQSMVQALFSDRFQLRYHWSQAEVRGLALTKARNGVKFPAYVPKAGDDEVNTGERQSIGRLSGRKITMSRLSDYLSTVIQAPIVDQTGLTGMYEINLVYRQDAKSAEVADLELAPLMIAIEEQLGLKLVKQGVPIQTFVVDHIERPTEN